MDSTSYHARLHSSALNVFGGAFVGNLLTAMYVESIISFCVAAYGLSLTLSIRAKPFRCYFGAIDALF